MLKGDFFVNDEHDYVIVDYVSILIPLVDWIKVVFRFSKVKNGIL